MQKLLFFILILIFKNSSAQNPEWERFLPTNTGLPGDYVYAVAIDSDGKKWIGAEDPVWDEGGVAVFDDEKWKVYNQFNSGLPNYYVSEIAIEKNGTKWISVSGYGVASYDGTNWTVYNTSNSPIPSNRISSIQFDRFGNKWFGLTSNNLNIGGLAKFDGTNWTIYNRDNSGLPGNLIGALAVDSLNNIWASVQYEGVVKFDGTNWTVHSNVASFDPAPFIAVDANNVIWVGSVGRGLYKYNGTSWTNYHRYNSDIFTDYIHCAAIENGTTLWLGSLGGPLIKYDQTTFTKFFNVPLSHMYTITIDRFGNKWVGGIGGITKFTESSMTTYSVHNTGLPERWANGISIDKNNIKWISTPGGAVSRFDGVIWRDFNPYNHGSEPWPFPTDQVHQTIFDKFGNVWAAVDGGGVGKWDGTSWSRYENGLTVNWVISVGIDSLQSVWAGVYNWGVGRLDQTTGTFTMYSINNSPLPSNYVRAFAANADSSMWLGTDNGLVKFKNNNWTIYKTTNSGIPHNWVTALDKDAAGNLWVGTYGGLAKFDGTTWTVYNMSNSAMPANSVADITINGTTIWVGCYTYQEDGGVAKFDGTTWQAWTTSNSPLPHKQVEAVELDRLGNLWISTASQGIAVFKEGGVSHKVFTLNVKAFIQGFYNESTVNQIKDTARIYLRSVASPYYVIDSAKAILDLNGNGIFTFTNAANFTSYYIVVKHRNGLETWSASGNSFNSGVLNYDFTLSASMAYGNNLILKGTKYCIYNGDVNQDEIIDVSDLGLTDNDVLNFSTGYLNTDVNGDNFIDAADLGLLDNNSYFFVGIQRP
ncbi:MAG: hypothetical protein M3R36_11875 [Bacteroidota bacterium]|nr:hypothetical protein [Bacteroidota bacterium]